MALQRLGKFQKGEGDSLEFAFYGFKGGLNIKAVGQLLDDTELTVAKDGYLRPDGGFQSRNGMFAYGTAFGNAPVYLARFYQDIRNSVEQAELTWLLAEYLGILHTVPWPNAGAATITGAGGANITNGNIGGTAAGPMTWCQIQNPSPLHFGGLTDCIVICTGAGGPYVFDGVNLYAPAGWANAAGAKYCALVNGIVWFGGIPGQPDILYGTGNGQTNFGDYNFETLAPTRVFVMSSPVTGLCAQGTGATASLIIGRNQGISVLFGTGVTTFYLQDVPFQDGVAAGLTMLSANGVAFFLGHMAYYSFDAQTIPTSVSQKIEPWILSDPLVPGLAFTDPVSGTVNYYGPFTSNWQLSWSAIYNNRLHVGYCSNVGTPNVIMCYDLYLNAWTLLVPNPGLACMILMNAPSDPNPQQGLVGSSTTGQIYIWDYVSASGDQALDGTYPVYPAVQSKYFKIGVPGTNKAVQRFYPEFQTTGAFTANITLNTDYGFQQTYQVLSFNSSNTELVWDDGTWDTQVWAGTQGFGPFGPPRSRCDFAGTQGESFSFGVTATAAQSPWIWAGGSGVYNQRGRT
jgi:hypothetical protein